MNQTRVYRSLDAVTDGLGLPDGDRARIVEELGQLGTGQEALRKVFPLLRRLRQETRNPQLVETLAKRFAAYVGNGLFKADADALVKASADKEKLRPPGGFTPIPGSNVWFKPAMISGKPKAYWHPGEGVSKDAPKEVQDLARREVVRIQQQKERNRASMSPDPAMGVGEGLRRLVGMHPAHYKEAVAEAERHARGVIAEKAPKPKPAPPKAAAPAAQQKAPAAPQAPPATPGAQVPQVAPAAKPAQGQQQAKPGAAPPPQGAPGSDPNKPHAAVAGGGSASTRRAAGASGSAAEATGAATWTASDAGAAATSSGPAAGTATSTRPAAAAAPRTAAARSAAADTGRGAGRDGGGGVQGDVATRASSEDGADRGRAGRDGGVRSDAAVPGIDALGDPDGDGEASSPAGRRRGAHAR